MKILLCLECNDLFNLGMDEKICQCGKTKGRYLDSLNAVYEGEKAFPIGFANTSFAKAILKQPFEGSGERFEAFVIPKQCPTFLKQKNPQ